MPHQVALLQLALQNQIEALQQQQAQLLQQQIASNQVMATLNNPQLGAGRRPNVHRRIQSQQVPTSPIGMVGGSFGGFGIPGIGFNAGLGGGVGLGVGGEEQGVPRGHGRRHSVNVLNKNGQNNLQPFNQFGQDGFDDGFAPPQAFGGHSRQASRADSTWRISECSCGLDLDIFNVL